VQGSPTATAAAERRKAIRFRFDTPVILAWTEPSGAIREDIGRTRDISILGAFVIYHSPLPTNTEVSLEVYLPPLERNHGQLLQFTGRGKVTRTSEAGKDGGFATRVRFVLKENTFALLGLLGDQPSDARPRILNSQQAKAKGTSVDSQALL
jgi:hypothetical protein